MTVVIGAMGPYHLARLAALHRLLSDSQCEMTLLLRNGAVTEYPWFRDAGAFPYRVERAYSTKVREPDATTSAFQIWQTLQNIRPDALIFGMPSNAYLSALAWGVLHSRSCILLSESKANDSPRTWLKEHIKRILYKRFHGAVVGGPEHVEYSVSLGIPESRCIEGYDVVDNEHFRLGSKAARANRQELLGRYRLPERYWVTANRFVAKKNLTRLLKAYAAYCKQTGNEAWPLILLGDGPERASLESLTAQLHLEGQVEFRGLANYEDLPVYYGLSEAFIHASTVEQWGLVANEAMASGTPVLLSKTCGCAPTLLKEGENGYSFDPFSVEDITDCLMRYHSLDKHSRRDMGKRSEQIIAEWGPERFAEAVWQCLNGSGAD